jgi:hypothetical protein
VNKLTQLRAKWRLLKCEMQDFGPELQMTGRIWGERIVTNCPKDLTRFATNHLRPITARNLDRGNHYREIILSPDVIGHVQADR